MSDEKKVPAKQSTQAVKKVENQKLGFGKRVGKWFREMRSELKKVVWPTPKQLVNNTLVALAFMAVAAVVIWGFDQIAQAGVRALISLAG